MNYCGNKKCPRNVGFTETEGEFCDTCGTELTPYIKCQCGKKDFNPKLIPLFCSQCGVELTVDYLGKCMSRQLCEMLEKLK